jgi:hypothetical protein
VNVSQLKLRSEKLDDDDDDNNNNNNNNNNNSVRSTEVQMTAPSNDILRHTHIAD